MTTEKNNKKRIAQQLYLDSGYTQEEIASSVGVARQTVSRWIHTEKWNELREAKKVTPAELIISWKKQIMEINQQIQARPRGERYASTAEADTIGKLTGAIKKLEGELGISDIVACSIQFLSWLRGVDADKAIEFNQLFNAFIKDKTK